MQSKEEIEKAKEILNNENVLFKIQKDVCLVARISIENAIKYIEQLETEKQKLIEKLEEDIKQNTFSDIEIDAIGSYAKEILKILKGENDE